MATGRLNMPQVKSQLAARAARWEAQENPLTELPFEEAIKYLGGAIHPDDVPIDQMEVVASRLHVQAKARRAALRTAPSAAPAPPSEVDWRSRNGKSYVTSVKFQGACGTCTCFSSAAATESAVCIATDTPPQIVDGAEFPDLSEAQMFYCGAAAQGRNCNAGWFLPAALAYLTTTGAAPESFFPYTSGDQSCGLKPGWEAVVTKITGSTKLATPDDVRAWLVKKGPVAAMLVAYQDLFAYRTGVYQHISGDRLGVHSVCIVGFSDSQQAWLCKNSWSAQWGEQGYFWLEYGQCGIESAIHGINGLSIINGKAFTTT